MDSENLILGEKLSELPVFAGELPDGSLLLASVLEDTKYISVALNANQWLNTVLQNISVSLNLGTAAKKNVGSKPGTVPLIQENGKLLSTILPDEAFKIGPQGPVGPYYIPSVSSVGILSWTNTGSLPNPLSVNIRGPEGPQGIQGIPGAQGEPGKDGTALKIDATGNTSDRTDYNDQASGFTFMALDVEPPILYVKNSDEIGDFWAAIDYRGPQGPQGIQGAPGVNGSNGEPGATFIPRVSSAGVLTWSNTAGLVNPSPVNIMGPAGSTGKQGPAGERGPGLVPKYSVTTAEFEAPGGLKETAVLNDVIYLTDTGYLWVRVATTGDPIEDWMSMEFRGPQGLAGSVGADGSAGATFYPSVGANGYIYWSNNGGLTNPTPVSIRGPAGPAFTYDDFTAEQLEALRGPAGSDGKQGVDGAPGPMGSTGPYYYPNYDINTGYLSWTNNGGLENPDPVQIVITGSGGTVVPGKDGVTFYPYFNSDTGELYWSNNGELTNPDPMYIVGPAGSDGKQGVDGAPGPEGPQGPAGETGPYFIPSYNSNTGELSWTNNGGLENPETMYIRGPAGSDGKQGVDGAPGPEGPQGQQGPAGADGPYFVPSFNSTTGYLSWSNTGGLENPADMYIVGPKGDAFTYADFTEEQLAGLVGPQGPEGPAGMVARITDWNSTTKYAKNALVYYSRGTYQNKYSTTEIGKEPTSSAWWQPVALGADPLIILFGATNSDDPSDFHTPYEDGDSYIITSVDGGRTYSGPILFTGPEGPSGNDVQIQYSMDSTTWYSNPVGIDAYYIRFSTDGGLSWGDGIYTRGTQGPKGDAFTFDDFTSTQLESLRGPMGSTGPMGPRGIQGPTGPYFYPLYNSISGFISWTNNGGFENPEDMYVRGDTGSAGKVQIVSVTTLLAGLPATISETSSSSDFNRQYILGIPRGAEGTFKQIVEYNKDNSYEQASLVTYMGNCYQAQTAILPNDIPDASSNWLTVVQGYKTITWDDVVNKPSVFVTARQSMYSSASPTELYIDKLIIENTSINPDGVVIIDFQTIKESVSSEIAYTPVEGDCFTWEYWVYTTVDITSVILGNNMYSINIPTSIPLIGTKTLVVFTMRARYAPDIATKFKMEVNYAYSVEA